MVKCGLRLQNYEEFIVLVLYIHVSHLLFKSEHGSGDTCSCITAHDRGAMHSFFLFPFSRIDTCFNPDALTVNSSAGKCCICNSAASDASPNENMQHTMLIKTRIRDAGVFIS